MQLVLDRLVVEAAPPSRRIACGPRHSRARPVTVAIQLRSCPAGRSTADSDARLLSVRAGAARHADVGGSRCRLRRRPPSCWRTDNCSRARSHRERPTPTACCPTVGGGRTNRMSVWPSATPAESADIEAGPVGRRDVQDAAEPSTLVGITTAIISGRELVANAGVAGPAIDVVAIAIVDADEAEPTGVHDLPGEAERILAISSDAGGAVRAWSRVMGMPPNAAALRLVSVVRLTLPANSWNTLPKRRAARSCCRVAIVLPTAQRQAADLAVDVVGRERYR